MGALLYLVLRPAQCMRSGELCPVIITVNQDRATSSWCLTLETGEVEPPRLIRPLLQPPIGHSEPAQGRAENTPEHSGPGLEPSKPHAWVNASQRLQHWRGRVRKRKPVPGNVHPSGKGQAPSRQCVDWLLCSPLTQCL